MKPDFPISATLLAFLAASLVLAATPGPGVLYVVTRTIAQGRRAGLTSVAGVALGNLCNAIGASLGLGALFAVSSAAFLIVKTTGAAYLVYLGFKALRPSATPTLEGHFRSAATGRAFREGFLVALLNPKTALFFAAFLPQFIDPASSAVLQKRVSRLCFRAHRRDHRHGLRPCSRRRGTGDHCKPSQRVIRQVRKRRCLLWPWHTHRCLECRCHEVSMQATTPKPSPKSTAAGWLERWAPAG